MNVFNIELFVKEKITKRKESLFIEDIESNIEILNDRIDNKSVLVIGGAGTIGSSFIKAILHFSPKKLYVIDINENGLTELTRDLRSSIGLNIPSNFKTYPIDFGNKIFEKLWLKEGPFDIIANFAAHKHVRSEKDEYSIEAMIENNVIKAKNLLDLIAQRPPEHFFCVSTDKAANPVSIMGASKKLMEDVIMAYSSVIPITTARFANVAFSNGSLLFGFMERLMKKQPLSVPTDIKRYFVSPEESGQLCMLSCLLGQSGEIFFPKMDELQMLSFKSITYDFLNEYNLGIDICRSENEARLKMASFDQHSNKYPVYFFRTDTSGEKPFEEFYTKLDKINLDKFSSLGIIEEHPIKTVKEINQYFNELNLLFQNKNISKATIVNWLNVVINDFHHTETGKNLDQKM